MVKVLSYCISKLYSEICSNVLPNFFRKSQISHYKIFFLFELPHSHSHSGPIFIISKRNNVYSLRPTNLFSVCKKIIRFFFSFLEVFTRFNSENQKSDRADYQNSTENRPPRPPKGEESRPQKILLHRPGSNIPHLPPVRQRLSLPHRPTQSYEEVQRPELTQPDAAIVSRDGRRPTTENIYVEATDSRLADR